MRTRWPDYRPSARHEHPRGADYFCNVRRVADLPSLWGGYLRDLLAVPGVRETVHMDDIKRHYYATHPNVNPTLIVPIGPELDYDEPHGREALGG